MTFSLGYAYLISVNDWDSDISERYPSLALNKELFLVSFYMKLRWYKAKLSSPETDPDLNLFNGTEDKKFDMLTGGPGIDFILRTENIV